MRRIRPEARAERGFTLIEVLISVALLSVAFIGILGAVAALITAGAENANATTTATVARNLAAFLQTQSYVPCGLAGTAAAAYNQDIAQNGFSYPSGFTPKVSAVDAWNGDTPATFYSPGGVPDTQGLCPAAGGDHGLERLTLTVTPGAQLGATAPRSLTILKRQ